MADHASVNISQSQISCGVLELSRITDAKRAAYQLASRLYHPARGTAAAVCMLSDVVGTKTNSNTFIGVMLSNKFGTVMISEPTENPKTGNMIFVATITIDHTKFKAWYSEERVKSLRRVGS